MVPTIHDIKGEYEGKYDEDYEEDKEDKYGTKYDDIYEETTFSGKHSCFWPKVDNFFWCWMINGVTHFDKINRCLPETLLTTLPSVVWPAQPYMEVL